MLAVACAMAWPWASAPAYVLQGPHILDLMVKSTGKARSLKVVQRLTVHGDGQAETAPELIETLRYIFPEKFRSDIEAENIDRVHVLSGHEDVTVVDGVIAPAADTGHAGYQDILLYRNRRLLEDRLTRLGMDVRVSSLARFQGRIAFVVGARYPDLSVSQLWVEKGSFRPIRWIRAKRPGETPEAPLDIRYLDWQKAGGLWYPMRIAYYRGEKLLREIQVDDIQIDPVFSADLFDVSRIRATYRRVPPPGAVQRTEKEIGEIDRAIEEFKKIYR